MRMNKINNEINKQTNKHRHKKNIFYGVFKAAPASFTVTPKNKNNRIKDIHNGIIINTRINLSNLKRFLCFHKVIERLGLRSTKQGAFQKIVREQQCVCQNDKNLYHFKANKIRGTKELVLVNICSVEGNSAGIFFIKVSLRIFVINVK